MTNRNSALAFFVRRFIQLLHIIHIFDIWLENHVLVLREEAIAIRTVNASRIRSINDPIGKREVSFSCASKKINVRIGVLDFCSIYTHIGENTFDSKILLKTSLNDGIHGIMVD